jgi:hypothetical protein
VLGESSNNTEGRAATEPARIRNVAANRVADRTPPPSCPRAAPQAGHPGNVDA